MTEVPANWLAEAACDSLRWPGRGGGGQVCAINERDSLGYYGFLQQHAGRDLPMPKAAYVEAALLQQTSSPSLGMTTCGMLSLLFSIPTAFGFGSG